MAIRICYIKASQMSNIPKDLDNWGHLFLQHYDMMYSIFLNLIFVLFCWNQLIFRSLGNKTIRQVWQASGECVGQCNDFNLISLMIQQLQYSLLLLIKRVEFLKTSELRMIKPTFQAYIWEIYFLIFYFPLFSDL